MEIFELFTLESLLYYANRRITSCQNVLHLETYYIDAASKTPSLRPNPGQNPVKIVCSPHVTILLSIPTLTLSSLANGGGCWAACRLLWD